MKPKSKRQIKSRPKNPIRRISLIGYGSQGRSLALNLKDSGFDVVVGLRANSRSRKIAKADGIRQIETIAAAAKAAKTIVFAYPDHLHGRVFERSVRKHLLPHPCLVFLHAGSVHFRQLIPPDDADVILVAPHAPGIAVREKYLTDRSISAFVAVYQDRSGRARQHANRLAGAAGFKKSRLIETTFEDEAIGDIFGEQAVLCGGLAMLLKHGFETLLESGLSAEKAYLEAIYQIDLIVDLIKKHGIEGMLKRISVTARYGAVEAGPRVIDKSTRKRMDKLYREIASGQFSQKLSQLDATALRRLDSRLKELTHPALDRAAVKFRK